MQNKQNNIYQYFNMYTIYLFLYILYSLQGLLYTSGSILSQSSILIMLCIGIVSFIKVNLCRTLKPYIFLISTLYIFISLSFLLSDKIVYGTLYEAIGPRPTFEQYKNISIFFLSFFVGYLYAQKTSIDDKKLFILTIFFFFSAILRYYNTYNTGLVRHEGNTAFTNNGGYSIVSILPFLPLIFKHHRKTSYLIFFVSLILIIYASKRGAIFCALAASAFTLYYYLRFNKLTPKKLSFLLIFVSFFVVFAVHTYSKNEYLQNRMTKTQTEGIGTREIAYSILWNHWYQDDNFITKFLGNGVSQSISIWGNYAHNDWLELLIDHGLVAVVLYIFIFLFLFLGIIKSNLFYTYKLSAYLALLIWFAKTIFSMGYTAFSNLPLTFLLGLIMSLANRKSIKTNF